MAAGWDIPDVRAADVAEDAYLLDVRDPDEWDAGHAPTAHHLPMMQIPARLDEVPADRDVVVVCKVGARSAQVVAFLRANGFDRASNLDGGMWAWQAAGRPIVGADGGAGWVL
jgi:rhodanese-related sulfurtransferase